MLVICISADKVGLTLYKTYEVLEYINIGGTPGYTIINDNKFKTKLYQERFIPLEGTLADYQNMRGVTNVS
jgi:hypothetical protein